MYQDGRPGANRVFARARANRLRQLSNARTQAQPQQLRDPVLPTDISQVEEIILLTLPLSSLHGVSPALQLESRLPASPRRLDLSVRQQVRARDRQSDQHRSLTAC